MHDRLYISNIRLEDFKSTLSRYEDVVDAKLTILDEQRYVKIPGAVAERIGDAHITKDELVKLVEWKLSHGKFRPTLLPLARSNSEDDVTEISKDGFETRDLHAALKIVTKLKGVGPATASLILSVHDPAEVPFFSDEVYRWCFFDQRSGQGWSREIKYTPKEYREMAEQVAKVLKRLRASDEGIKAVDVEKVAYVLNKDDVVASATNAASSKAGKKRTANVYLEPIQSKAAKKDEKIERKKDDNRSGSEPRRSTRTKGRTSQ